jgi:hypothetical protein
MSVKRVIILCVHSAVFTIIVTLKHLKRLPQTSNIMAVKDNLLLSIIISCITTSDN